MNILLISWRNHGEAGLGVKLGVAWIVNVCNVHLSEYCQWSQILYCSTVTSLRTHCPKAKTYRNRGVSGAVIAATRHRNYFETPKLRIRQSSLAGDDAGSCVREQWLCRSVYEVLWLKSNVKTKAKHSDNIRHGRRVCVSPEFLKESLNLSTEP
jgi:hypothetical protein